MSKSTKNDVDLLKEVVAEAKAVRETAIANARITLEEQFTPQLQSLFSAKLEEMDDEEEEMGGEEVELEVPMDGGEVEVSVAPEAPAEAPMEAPPEDVVVDDEEELDEFSYESIIREFENEEAMDTSEPNLEEEKEEDDEDKEPVDELAKSSGIGSSDNKKPSKDSWGAPTEYDTNKAHSVPNSKTTAPLSKDESESHDGQYVVKHSKTPALHESDDVDINAVIRELREELAGVDTVDVETENKKLNETLGKYKETVNYLRGKLNEVNLLNAKLLFTNKLFKAHSLNESQKMKVIDSLDRAGNLREAKIVFTTLNEAFSSTAKFEKKIRKSINENKGLASQTVESTKPSEETGKKILEEGEDYSGRWQFLAGIKK